MLCRSHRSHKSHERDSSHADSSRAHQHVLPIGHANEENVVEGVHTINLGEQLVDDSVVHACRAQQTQERWWGFVGGEKKAVSVSLAVSVAVSVSCMDACRAGQVQRSESRLFTMSMNSK